MPPRPIWANGSYRVRPEAVDPPEAGDAGPADRPMAVARAPTVDRRGPVDRVVTCADNTSAM